MKFLLFLLLFCKTATAQPGHIRGIVFNEKKQPIVNASVHIFRIGRHEGAAITGIDGDYIIMPQDTGLCHLMFTHPGYDTLLLKNTRVTQSTNLEKNITLIAR